MKALKAIKQQLHVQTLIML